MFKKPTIVCSILLNSMHAFNVEPASSEINTEDAHFRVMQRVMHVHNFIRIAENALSASDDGTRVIMARELVNSFQIMKETLGDHYLVGFQRIDSKQKATNAITYYKNAKQKLFNLISAS